MKATIWTIGGLLSLVAPSGAALTAYSQNFDGLNAADSSGELGGEGWQWFVNVFDPTGTTYFGGYPGGSNFGGPSAAGISGAPGDQQLVVYSDYNNGGDHSAGNLLETNVFIQQSITSADAGQSWFFNFDAAPAATNPSTNPTTTIAFVKVFDTGFGLVDFQTIDTTSLSAPLTNQEISVTIDPGLAAAGGFLQFGFANTTTSFANSAVDYDNVVFSQTPIPEPSTALLSFLATSAFIVLRKR